MASEETTKGSDRSGGGVPSAPKKRLPWSRSRQLERDLEHVNREIYGRNLELAQTNKTLALLQAIDSLVLNDSNALELLCTKLAKEIVAAGYPVVAILGRPATGHGDLGMMGWAAAPGTTKPRAATMANIHLRADLHWFQKKDILKFVNVKELTDAEIARYCGCDEKDVPDIRKALGTDTVCCIKLSARQRLVGVMVVGFSDPAHTELSDFEKALFIRLSEAVGIAIDHKMLLEENQRVVGQLERSNRKLRLLDRTKDDFISMASHQLRTPLTSVKGYVSMVLEGDAGKISDTQRKLLNQSFVSSQRMVYLIADLLNVSRLRTGKFIIEPVPCNLVTLVEEEVEQLRETAKGRDLTLTFHKPPHFPTVMLDETKIRQVTMNFIDNAVYYTPNKGHIDVHLVEKPESIEFTVVDDGIGVPKSEQHHLFSKFYRAHNAKRLRPDGTGLGIFMAKKVIIAQGGAVIFKSIEGKGSTFGFSIAKRRLKPVPQATSGQHAPEVPPVTEPKETTPEKTTDKT